ncbi:ABC transporter substrate-binding protein [Bradyrhizobium commune]|uniref:ABC transporter substrate-binding protein n=1 Tax=Bradyrhizobium commune TaxID=83627 RepID=A0A7S9D9A1_9BRAD|nr:ABC transporter substrate-binding protein [Bradyrhizobium commune]QPF93507.1 ABC transporter substrate-binding protein [Bradyrhizobium commune]
MNRREFVALSILTTVVRPPDVYAEARLYRIALLTLYSSESADLVKGPLRDLGYIDGKNLSFIYRSADGDPGRLAAIAEDLVRDKPDVLVAGWGTLAPKALKAATDTIPIVFATVGDPIGAGLVQSLAHPGGNLTGLSGQSTEFKSKQLELLLGCIPGQRVIGVLLNPDTPYGALALAQLQTAAEQRGVRLELLEVRRPEQFTAERMDRLVLNGATSLMIVEDPLAAIIRDEVVAQALRLRLPTMSGFADYARSGGLMTYGFSQTANYRRAAELIDKILKGARPGDLPVEQPTRFELIVNLKTAKAFNLELPSLIMAAADEVIE